MSMPTVAVVGFPNVGKSADGFAVVEVGLPLQRRQRHAAVHRPRVEIGEADLTGNPPRDRGLAGRGGPVDRNHHPGSVLTSFPRLSPL